MFEIGWSELLVIAIVALIVFPTKDLPKLLRTAGMMMGKARRMAGDFQSQFNAALREAEREIELSEVKDSLKSMNPLNEVSKSIDPIRSIGDDLRKTVADVGRVDGPAVPPAAAVKVANEAAAAAGGDIDTARSATAVEQAVPVQPAAAAPVPDTAKGESAS